MFDRTYRSSVVLHHPNDHRNFFDVQFSSPNEFSSSPSMLLLLELALKTKRSRCTDTNSTFPHFTLAPCTHLKCFAHRWSIGWPTGQPILIIYYENTNRTINASWTWTHAHCNQSMTDIDLQLPPTTNCKYCARAHTQFVDKFIFNFDFTK